MVEITSQVRRWGRSVGVVIPKEAAEKAHIKTGDKVRLLIMGKNPLHETFGILKLKRPTEEILKEVDREGWDE
ncbi:MAG: AbrB/MazE/SpoVT family DNA-binding domain-containing protein [Candidatus Diapherotrites archaeon]|uniref:AbrB/MazE/SpoVT family DNA-binding domain-containing protein n=1 Tax=Candidatus Iainarchaeum sp. TaxID=3101447 RepID=A0A938YWN9_9ARCH|nr:AbrB/MazE/SpoVT family DNA-binding domain-containing protein [Candidatus Diapherotrites archaeon]